jgi:hypothetical protein
MLEVKQIGEKLTPKEEQWLKTFPASVVHTIEEAYRAVGIKVVKQEIKNGKI